MIENIAANAPLASRVVVAGVCMEPDRFRPALAGIKEIDLRFVFRLHPTGIPGHPAPAGRRQDRRCTDGDRDGGPRRRGRPSPRWGSERHAKIILTDPAVAAVDV